MKRIYLAGGCFRGVEHYLSLINGIINTTVGYANSDIENPKYEEIKQHKYKAIETVCVDYDPNLISLSEILKLYFLIIDPTNIDKQGNDIGYQYKTGIYYIDKEDYPIIIDELNIIKEKYKDKEVVVEVKELINFYDAEEYHQEYLIKNPTGYCHIGKEFFELAKNYKGAK